MAKNEKEVKEKKVSYFKAMKAELKKVTWPTAKELVKNTVAVISFVLIITLIVFVLDSCFNAINKYGIAKLQDSLQTSFKGEENAVESNQDENNSSTESVDVTTGEDTGTTSEENSTENEKTEKSE